jgi:hypothetical protein
LPHVAELDPAHDGFTEADMGLPFSSGDFAGGKTASLRDLVDELQAVYCGSIGAEYMFITQAEQKRWLAQRLESPQMRALPRRGEPTPHPREDHCRRDPRALPAHPLRRAEAILAGGRRDHDRRARPDDPAAAPSAAARWR